MPTKILNPRQNKNMNKNKKKNKNKKQIKNQNNIKAPSPPIIGKVNDASYIFSNIYNTNHWLYGSGEGSLIENTKTYIYFLENYFRTLPIKKISDIGCGDWQFSRYINWDNYEYTGYDVVQHLIDNHQLHYQKENIHFQQFDILQNYQQFPETEVIILKDVIQHWPTMNIVVVLSFLQRKCKYMIITNCCYQNELPKTNVDIPLGEFRPIEFSIEPLNIFNVEKIFEFHTKKTYLLKGLL